MTENIRLLIVDDHPVVRHGLRSLLTDQDDLEVVDEAANAAELFPILTRKEVDVILLDIRLEGQNGIEIARRISQSYPDVKIIVLTTYNDESYLRQAMEVGVHGFLLKSASHETLPDSIRAVFNGEKLLSPSLVTHVIGDYQRLLQEETLREFGLTAEDIQILSAIASGESNREIAEKFFVSEATIKRRIQEIIEKMDASNRSQAIAEAVRRGWI